MSANLKPAPPKISDEEYGKLTYEGKYQYAFSHSDEGRRADRLPSPTERLAQQA